MIALLVDRVDVFVQSIEQIYERASLRNRERLEKAFLSFERHAHDAVVKTSTARREDGDLTATSGILGKRDQVAFVKHDEAAAHRRFIESGAVADRARRAAGGAAELREDAPLDDADSVALAVERRSASRKLIGEMIDEGGHVPRHVEHTRACVDTRRSFLRAAAR